MVKRVTDVFMGIHPKKLDEKGRIVLPKNYREIVEHKEQEENEIYGLVILPDNKYLVIMPLRAIFEGAAKGDLNNPAQTIAPFSEPLRCDKMGRVSISAEHKKRLNLTSNEMVMVGAYDRVEIWPEEEWNKVGKPKRSRKAVEILEGRPSYTPDAPRQ